MVLPLVDKEVHDGVDNAHNDAGKNSTPNFHFDAGEEIDGEDNHDSVDDDSRKTHGENSEREGKHFDEGFNDGVDEGENESGNREKHPGVFIDRGAVGVDLPEPSDTKIHADARSEPA